MKVLVVCSVFLFACPSYGADVVDYAKDVLPIMKEHCWDCHSKEKSVKGNLALDDLDGVREDQIGKYNIIRPGNPAESGFMERLRLDANHADFMPREGSPLPKDAITTIEKWIEQGAIIDASKVTEDEAKRLADGTGKPLDTLGFHQWTNRAGKVIEARILSMDDRSVKLVLANGKSYDVPFDTLSPESVALAKQLGAK